MVRSQHARENDSPGPEIGEAVGTLLPANPHNTRARSRSRSVARDEESMDRRGGASTPNGVLHDTRNINGHAARQAPYDDGGLLAKPSKAKNFNEKKTSVNEMKKRVSAILEFVQRAQSERSGAEGSSSTGMSRSTSEAGVMPTAVGAADRKPESTKSTAPLVTVENGEPAAKVCSDDKGSKEAFEHLSAAEMLVSLKTRLVAFEGSYGRWGDGR